MAKAADALGEARRDLASLRRRVDRVLAGSPDPDLATSWFPAATGVIAREQALFDAVRAGIAGSLPGALHHGLDIKRALWDASEFAGRERGRLNAAIAGRQVLAVDQVRAWRPWPGASKRRWPRPAPPRPPSRRSSGTRWRRPPAGSRHSRRPGRRCCGPAPRASPIR